MLPVLPWWGVVTLNSPQLLITNNQAFFGMMLIIHSDIKLLKQAIELVKFIIDLVDDFN